MAKAKGANEFARLNDVVVFRTVDGKLLAALYELDQIRRGLYADPRIYPADLVVVGETTAMRKLVRFRAGAAAGDHADRARAAGDLTMQVVSSESARLAGRPGADRGRRRAVEPAGPASRSRGVLRFAVRREWVLLL